MIGKFAKVLNLNQSFLKLIGSYVKIGWFSLFIDQVGIKMGKPIKY